MQFERQGYFCRDRIPRRASLVFNRTIGLRDTFAKVAKNTAKQPLHERGSPSLRSSLT